jgi:predicted ATP-grasp superfamily ATP-dependent carboligase
VTGQTVLIAAFSGRALAQSARRAGYVPLVADCFGDIDMKEAAEASRVVPALAGSGFRGGPLIAALEALEREAPSKPIGLVLGSGFEATPKLVQHLSENFALIGSSPVVIQRSKNPESFFGLLKELGVRHPETQSAPPANPKGWLMKRVGGSGGAHVVTCPASPRPDRRHYFQHKEAGEAISAMMLCGRSCAFAFSTQWTSPVQRMPYRYGGSNGWVGLDEDVEARIVDTCLQVAKPLGLTGMVSFDFLVANGEPLLLEVNPRPGASLEVLDDERGTLFAAHIEASKPGGDPAALIASRFRAPPPKSANYLYADRGALSIGAIAWPAWAADRPPPGTRFARHQPIATVIAEGPDPAAAKQLCETRLGQLADMLYEENAGKETS